MAIEPSAPTHFAGSLHLRKQRHSHGLRAMTGLAGKTIWVIAKGYAPDEGGMQTYAKSVADAYAERGATVTVIAQTSIGPRRDRIGAVDLIDLGPGRSPLVIWKFCAALRDLERRTGPPDLLHATTWRTAVPAMMCGYSYAVTFHGREFMYAQGPVLALMRRVARKASRRIAVSHYSEAKLRERLAPDRGDIHVAWNGTTSGLSSTGAARAAGSPPVILSLCRLEPRKNIRSAVLAAAYCNNAGHDFRFILCGRGPEQRAIEALIDDLPSSVPIEMAGFVDQARAEQLYADADIFIHPQINIDRGRDFEGFGIAIADAMYSGQAVIIGQDGGASELVIDGQTGLVVNGRDANAVAAALEKLLKDPGLRERIGREAAQWARGHFRWDRHVEIVAGSGPTDPEYY